MNPIEMARIRSEALRWLILSTVEYFRPQGVNTEQVLDVLQHTYSDCTHRELRRELDYLETRELVSIAKDPLDKWFVNLTRYGIEVVQYTCPCDPGISRPRITQA